MYYPFIRLSTFSPSELSHYLSSCDHTLCTPSSHPPPHTTCRSHTTSETIAKLLLTTFAATVEVPTIKPLQPHSPHPSHPHQCQIFNPIDIVHISFTSQLFSLIHPQSHCPVLLTPSQPPSPSHPSISPLYHLHSSLQSHPPTDPATPTGETKQDGANRLSLFDIILPGGGKKTTTKITQKMTKKGSIKPEGEMFGFVCARRVHEALGHMSRVIKELRAREAVLKVIPQALYITPRQGVV